MDKHAGMPAMSDVFFALCKSVDSAVSLGAWLRFKHNQLALATMEINPGDYLSLPDFELDYLVVSFLSKWKGLKTGLDLEAEAIKRFTTSEAQCKETNERLRKSRRECINSFTSAVLFTAKRKISRLLGVYSNFIIEEGLGWGPGATRTIPRRMAFHDTKMCELPVSVSSRAAELFCSVVARDRNWLRARSIHNRGREDKILMVDNCKIECVPKNAKTHRVIAKEPTANTFLQKGVGRYLRKRLQRVGINLDDQGPNQDAARAAYSDGLATLDLKAASDTVAIELVYELFPLDWANALDSLRSHKAVVEGSEITLQKFSSMGNGFTFEVETVIFWSIVSSIEEMAGSGKKVLVYGDDIICGADISELVVSTLAFCGFTVNKEKSFTHGEFYESCGKHYFKGFEVTPCYQKEELDSPQEVIRCANRLIRCAWRLSGGFRLRKELEPPWRVLWRYRGASGRFQLPFGAEGDDGWLLTAEEFTPIWKSKSKLGYFAESDQSANFGLRCKVISPIKRRLPAFDDAFYALHLRALANRPGKDVEQALWNAMPDVIDRTWEGEVDLHQEKPSQITRESYRWVMPSGEFGATWL